MLGLRQVHGCQIDLWQGDIEKFHLDGKFFCAPCQKPPFHAEALNNREDFIRSWQNGSRHLGVFVSSIDSVDRVLREAIAACEIFGPNLKDSKLSGHLPRITCVAPNAEIYDTLQSSLFALVSEEDS